MYKLGGSEEGILLEKTPLSICSGVEVVCNGTTKAKQKRSTENAEPRVGCTNKPGDVQGEWSAIGTCALGLFAHKAHPLLQRGGGARTTIRGSLFTSTPKASVFGSTSGMLLF